MECPVCRESMVVIEYKSIELDYCVGCMGVWFDRGEIELLLENAGISVSGDAVTFEPSSQKTREIGRPCPLCGRTMLKVSTPGSEIVLDQCPEDGVWFDSGELPETIRRFAGKDHVSVMTVLQDYLGEALTEKLPADENE